MKKGTINFDKQSLPFNRKILIVQISSVSRSKLIKEIIKAWKYL